MVFRVTPGAGLRRRLCPPNGVAFSRAPQRAV